MCPGFSLHCCWFFLVLRAFSPGNPVYFVAKPGCKAWSHRHKHKRKHKISSQVKTGEHKHKPKHKIKNFDPRAYVLFLCSRRAVFKLTQALCAYDSAYVAQTMAA